MQRVGSIYTVTNQHTGEQYVGQTLRSVKKRWDAHWRTAICAKARKAKFQNAILAFGKEAFVVEEVYVAFDEDALNVAEMKFISELHPSYNATAGGKGMRKAVISDATKKLRADAARLRWSNPEWKAKTLKSSAAARNTPDAIAQRAAMNACRPPKKKWVKPPVVNRRTPQEKAAALAASWADPIVRQKRIDGQRKAFSTPEVRARLSAALTGRVMPRTAVEKSARAKWKPLYCPEIQVSFLCGKFTAEYFGVLRTSVANAVKQKGKLLRKYSLEMVA